MKFFATIFDIKALREYFGRLDGILTVNMRNNNMYENRRWLKISEAKKLTGQSEHAIGKFFDKNIKNPRIARRQLRGANRIRQVDKEALLKWHNSLLFENVPSIENFKKMYVAEWEKRIAKLDEKIKTCETQIIQHKKNKEKIEEQMKKFVDEMKIQY